MIEKQDKRKTCPPELIRFKDLLPRGEVRGGKSRKVLFGTLDNLLREDKRKRDHGFRDRTQEEWREKTG